MNQDPQTKNVTTVDLESCESEPIHIPGRIQPFGCLLSVNRQTWGIEHASVNAAAFLGLSGKPLVGAYLPDVIGRANFEQLTEREQQQHRGEMMFYFRIPAPDGQLISATTSSLGDSLLLELEIADSEDSVPMDGAVLGFTSAAANTLTEYLQRVADGVRSITGYDRTMIYRYDHQWNGEVIAESKIAELDPWLGHHYPASDIPAQAREIFLRNWIRIIPDVNYTPVLIEPTINPKTKKPLDLSVSILRSVSPIHIEYLQNMEVGASMTISLICNGRLWGLIACHHRTPKYIGATLRSLSAFIGKLASYRISLMEQTSLHEAQKRIKSVITKLEQTVSQEATVEVAVRSVASQLKSLIDCSGVAIFEGSDIHTDGITPESADLLRLRSWLDQQGKDSVITENLGGLYERGRSIATEASGMIAAHFGPDWIVWFRPEVVKNITWAGNPDKAKDVGQGDGKLHPRKSFAAWQQKMAGTATPWSRAEVLATAVMAATFAQKRKLGQYLTQNLGDAEREYTNLLTESLRDSARDLTKAGSEARYREDTMWFDTVQKAIDNSRNMPAQ